MAHRRPPLPPGPYLVVGLARSGVAAALALAAARPGERVVAVDSARPEEALAERERLAAAGVEVHLESDGTQALEASPPPATLVKSPGVPRNAPVVGQARRRGLEVVGELEIGWRMLPNEFIAVTGTNGKTTTVELIGAMHRAAGEPVAVAGNVGTPLTALPGTAGNATIVCEASSFQLEDSVAFAPEAAVFLNISDDHLDRHASAGEYLDAKLRIFANQHPADLAVVNARDADLLPGIGARTITFGDGDMRREGDMLVWHDDRLIDVGEVRLRGEHNLNNAMAAAAVSLERGIDRGAVRTALREFAGLPHRMEPVAEVRGVEYVNDSKATNPGAAAAALDACGGGVHAIMGGSLKGGDFSELESDVSASCRACYLIGEAADRLAHDLSGSGVELVRCGDMERAVAEASRRARTGETVLLSPACASFDQYSDYEERGEHFRALVEALAQERR